MTKYRNRKVTDHYGESFDSLLERDRWWQLRQLQEIGDITGLARQVVFELAPAVKLDGRQKPALRYVADFVYFKMPGGERVVEDAKGVETPVARIKRHLMATVHGIAVRIYRVRAGRASAGSR